MTENTNPRQRTGGIFTAEQAPAAEHSERDAARRDDSSGPAIKAAPPTTEAQPAATTVGRLPRSLRELGHAIFCVANPVKVGAELLQPGEQRADPTRLNALKAFADWAWGERNASADRKPRRVIWDLPCPPYEPLDPVETAPEASEGGEE